MDNKQAVKITKLDWDSEFFGFSICRINGECIKDSIELKNTLEHAKETGYKLCYLIADSDNVNLNKIAEDVGGLLADEKATFSISLTGNNETKFSEGVTEFSGDYSLDDMHDLAVQSSHESRFRKDPGFESGKCDEMYRIWMDKSIANILASKVYIYPEGKNVCGMITLYESGGKGMIGLIGVDSSKRGKNIGRKLISKSIEYFSSNGIREIHVDTQIRNKGACDFYRKCGFNLSDITNIYHFWIK